MRLPQSSIQPLSAHKIQLLTFSVALLFGGLLPKCAAQLTSSPPNLHFGVIDVGQNETQLLTLTNTGTSSVTIASSAMSGSEFASSPLNLPLTLSAGQSVDVNITFTPTATGWTGGSVRFFSNAPNPTLLVQLGGTGVTTTALAANPAVLSFGSVAVGKSATLPVTITNSRSWGVQLNGLQTSGTAFAESGGTFPMTLPAGQSIVVNITFTPQSAGEVGGSIFLNPSGLNIPLTGTGTAVSSGTLVVAPTPLNFGNVTVGQSATELLSLTASGGSVTIYSATSGNSQFALEGATFPLTLSSGQSVSYDVAFAPQNAGADSGSLSFSSNASNSQVNESLNGTGVAQAYSVSLSWNSSQEVTGYNVYRSTSANGTFTKINSALNANTAYTDSSVTSGQTYYYAATSVNSAGQESAKSTPAIQVSVP
jgi:hypothetical protein